MAWAIITIYTSKCAQMDPNSCLKRQNCIPDVKSVISKNRRGWVPPPLGSRKVKMNILGTLCLFSIRNCVSLSYLRRLSASFSKFPTNAPLRYCPSQDYSTSGKILSPQGLMCRFQARVKEEGLAAGCRNHHRENRKLDEWNSMAGKEK